MMGEKSAVFTLPGGYANAASAVMDRQNGHGKVQLVAPGALVSVAAVKQTRRRGRPRIQLSGTKISNALKGHPHIFVARDDLSTSGLLCCGLTFGDLSQTSIRTQGHCLRFFKPAGLPAVLSGGG